MCTYSRFIYTSYQNSCYQQDYFVTGVINIGLKYLRFYERITKVYTHTGKKGYYLFFK